MSQARLVLDDGTVFQGRSWGATGKTFGEAVFSTGMTGYQETITDPSYHRQVVVMTSPQIGNTGFNSEDYESDRIWVSGLVARNPSPVSSNWRSTETLDDALVREGIVAIKEVDTRALTLLLRERGAMRVGIFSGAANEASEDELLEFVRASPEMIGANLCDEVSTRNRYSVAADSGLRISILDLGIKRNTPRLFAEKGIASEIFPAWSTIDEVLSVNPDGVFLSNGPGDPSTAHHAVRLAQEVIRREIPLLGICFGHQVIGQALGLDTYKLRYGHHGINQPVQDLRTRKVEITAHNHGFAVSAPVGDAFETAFGFARATHVCLNDGVVEGLELVQHPVLSVQYHPEAAAGPHDAAHLFTNFKQLLLRARGQN
ncbi:MAG TPA: glutamine-hydrolyzing carbamoyl-phosphate synthase small subunit [Candidatus Nanopelagicaceae bacterium]|nr:glutamine-hydrolyzing carbamoyl-phosphate synthase small subunit [Candidatus Nanopelagicaceae bacterium]